VTPGSGYVRKGGIICLTVSTAWVTIAAVYLYPDVKEEFEQHRYLRRIGKLHTPVIPIECPRARGIENQDFISPLR
jgi:hypothetical protein